MNNEPRGDTLGSDWTVVQSEPFGLVYLLHEGGMWATVAAGMSEAQTGAVIRALRNAQESGVVGRVAVAVGNGPEPRVDVVRVPRSRR